MPYFDDEYKNSSLKVTDYKYEPMENYTYAIEGYGHGRINNDGYVNLDDYDSNKEINILMIGSSQFEAFQVDIKDSVTAKLNEMLQNKFVYNIGISSNLFPKSISNIAPAINKYKPTDYIILETSNVVYSKQEMIEVLENDDIKTNLQNTGLLQSIKKIVKGFYKNSPFLRLFRNQVTELISRENSSKKTVIESFDETLTEKILNKIKVRVDKKVKVIIVYHPSTKINDDGSLELLEEQENVNKFKELCEENNIILLDMSERFKKEYNDNHVLPYGFSNTTIGKGHLNKYGHKMISEELYKIIKGGK